MGLAGMAPVFDAALVSINGWPAKANDWPASAGRSADKTMKTYLLAAALLCGVALPTHATIICGAPTQTLGKTGTSPVISSVVWHDGPTWNAVHTLRDGTRIDRSIQYTMQDTGDGWKGWLNRTNHLWTTGQVFAYNNSAITYVETLYDTAKGNAVIMRSSTDCHRSDPTPAYVPPVVSAPAPAYAPPAAVYNPPPPAAVYNPPASSAQVVVPLNSASNGREQSVNVTVDSIPVSMLIDSGCNTLALSRALADQLIAQGEATDAGTINMSLAADQHRTVRKLIVHRVQIGDRVLTDLIANDGGSADAMLLGQSVLSQFGRFAIDLKANQLLLG